MYEYYSIIFLFIIYNEYYSLGGRKISSVLIEETSRNIAMANQ